MGFLVGFLVGDGVTGFLVGEDVVGEAVVGEDVGAVGREVGASVGEDVPKTQLSLFAANVTQIVATPGVEVVSISMGVILRV